MPVATGKSDPITKKVDPTRRGVIQTGYVDGESPRKPDLPGEVLTKEQEIEKSVYQRVLKVLIPEFQIKKLERQSLAQLKEYIVEITPMIREEILERYKNLSP